MSRTISEVAMGFLARREHSRHELATKLAKKLFDRADIQSCLDRLESDNYLSNQRFIESFTRHRSNSGFGPRRILADLLQRGIVACVAENYLSSVEIDWEMKVREAWCKKFNQAPADFKTLAKQTRFLLQRGFEPDSVQRLLQSVKKEVINEIHDH
jgi:regulatory protein